MRLTTTFLLIAVAAISGCKTGMRQSADHGCAACCGATAGYAKGGCTTSCGACGDTVSQAQAEAGKRIQVAAKPAPQAEPNPYIDKQAEQAERAAAKPPVLRPQTSIYRHAGDYGWLVGRLQRVHVPGAEWKIRYAELDQHDEWGGSMVLARDIRLDSFEDGQLVYVEGEILAERPSAYITGPLYRVSTIRPVVKQDRIAPASQ